MQFCWYYILQILAHFFTRLFPRDSSVLVLMILFSWTAREVKFGEIEFQKSYCRIFVEFMNHETIFEIRKKVLGFTWIRSGVSWVETPVL